MVNDSGMGQSPSKPDLVALPLAVSWVSSDSHFKTASTVVDIAWKERVLAAQPADLNSIPRTHVMEVENWLPAVL